jgi:transcriptional regulator with PAS, ATPase and Fis domain/tetratricopeptide (TPR) repeat protein
MDIPEKRIELIEFLAAEKNYKSAQAELEKLKKGNDSSFNPEGEVYYLEGLILFGLARYREAQEKGERAYQLLKHTSNNQRIAQVQLLLGNVFVATGELKTAGEKLHDAIASFRRVEDQKGMAEAYNKLAQVFFIQAEFERAVEALSAASEHAQKTTSGSVMQSRISGNLGRIHLLLGEWDKATRCLQESIQQNEPAKNELSICKNLLSLGYAAALQRKFEQAEGFYQRAYHLIRKLELKRERAIYHEYQAEMAHDRKDYETALLNASQAIQLGEEIAPQSSLLCQSYRILAQIHLATQKLHLAENYCQRSWELARSLNERMEEGILHRIWAQIAKEKNNKKLSRERFGESLSLLEKIGCRFELARTYLGAGEAEVFDSPNAFEYLKKAQNLFKELFPEKSEEYDYYEGLSQLALAKAHLETTDFDSSIDSLNQAEERLGRIKAENLADKEEILRNISAFRQEVEKKAAERSLSLDNRYNVVRRFLSEVEEAEVNSPHPVTKEDEVKQNLMLLAKRIQADRGFITLKNEENQFSPPLYGFNLTAEEAEKLHLSFSRLNGELTSLKEPIYSTSSQGRTFFETEKEVTSLLLIPLKTGEEMKGLLYLDREKNGLSATPFHSDELNLAVAFAEIMALKVAEIENRKLGEENLRLKEQLKDQSAFSNIITQNSDMLEILWKLHQVKDTNLSILLEGETGTGKDQVAKAIHYNSNRKNKSFVVVNCAAFPETLLENELFGHKKGAYTGASQDKTGFIQEADGGTLYLDEIAEINPATQIKLLRVLEEKEYTRLGDTKPRKVDIRVISATSLKIKEQIEKGLFRKDLFFRLNTIHATLPPLRRRKEDIPLLVNHFVKIHTAAGTDKLPQPSPAIMELFNSYDWPGNVRELENEVKRLVAIKDGEAVVASDLLSEKFGMDEETDIKNLSLYERVAAWEKQFILKALIENNWVKKSAASSLGIPESSLRFKIKQLKIKTPVEA